MQSFTLIILFAFYGDTVGLQRDAEPDHQP